MGDRHRVVQHKKFRGGKFVSWDKVLAEAAEYASRVGPDRLINISHSMDGIVVVWFWSSERDLAGTTSATR